MKYLYIIHVSLTNRVGIAKNLYVNQIQFTQDLISGISHVLK